MNDFYKFSCLSVAGRNASNMNNMEYLRNIMGIEDKTTKAIKADEKLRGI